MAENIKFILSSKPNKNEKIMVWTHSGHISKSEPRMGSYLAQFFKGDYYSIGLDFNKGSFRTIGLSGHSIKTFNLPKSKDGSTGDLFSNINKECFFLDIDNSVKDNAATRQFFESKVPQLSIGAGFYENNPRTYYLDEPLSNEYDGLIFINNITRSIPLETKPSDQGH